MLECIVNVSIIILHDLTVGCSTEERLSILVKSVLALLGKSTLVPWKVSLYVQGSILYCVLISVSLKLLIS